MFNPFKWYDEMLDIYTETVKGSKDEQTVDTVFLEFECPKEDADELCAMVANWLSDNGYNPEDFYAG
jgi:hypothetical protein